MKPPLILLLLAGCFLAASAPVKRKVKYHAANTIGPHSWHHTVVLQKTRFRSEEWTTGFFDLNNVIITGEIISAGDTLALQPQNLTYFQERRFVKDKGWKYDKKTCACRTLLADSSLPHFSASMTPRQRGRLIERYQYFRAQCSKSPRFVLLGYSLLQTTGFKTVLRQVH